jgi:hypothetical protein
MQDSSYNYQANPGMFVPTTNVWDTSQLYSVNVNSEDFKELLVRLYQNINNIALALNLKDTGYYSIEEFLNSQLYFPNPNEVQNPLSNPLYRQVFRTVVNFGILPNAGTTSIPHNININNNYSFTRIYATATNTGATSFIPLPYASSTLNQNITLNADTLNVNITTAIDYSSYTLCYVVLEYIKS